MMCFSQHITSLGGLPGVGSLGHNVILLITTIFLQCFGTKKIQTSQSLVCYKISWLLLYCNSLLQNQDILQRFLARSVPHIHRDRHESRMAKTTEKDLRATSYIC